MDQVTLSLGAAVLGLVVGAVLTATRERANWFRDARLHAYGELVAGSQDAMTAMDMWHVEGRRIQEAVAAFECARTRVFDANAQIRLIGSPQTVDASYRLDGALSTVGGNILRNPAGRARVASKATLRFEPEVKAIQEWEDLFIVAANNELRALWGDGQRRRWRRFRRRLRRAG